MNKIQTKCYNSFVDIIRKNKIFLTRIEVRTNGNKALHFTIDSTNGFTVEEANKYFSYFIESFPGSGISYNLKSDMSDMSALELAMREASETWINVDSDGSMLIRMSSI